MDLITEPGAPHYCFSCLRNAEERSLSSYCFQNLELQSIAQGAELILCYVCKRIAQHSDLFLQNVKETQKVLIDKCTHTSHRDIVNLTQSAMSPTDYCQSEDFMTEERFTITGIGGLQKQNKVKMELKEEDACSFFNEMSFADDASDFQEPYIVIKPEDLDKLVKTELDARSIPLEELISIKKTLKTKDKPKVKKKNRSNNCVARSKVKGSNKGALMYPKNLQQYIITKEECLKERARMATDENFTRAPYKCMMCLVHFRYKSTFKVHNEKRHSEKNGPFECDICKSRMNSETKHKLHYIKHLRRYKCPECNLVRSNHVTIREHIDAVHTARQHTCPHCTKSFKRSKTLKKHLSQVHTSSRVICDYCQKSYKHTDVLVQHFHRMHPKEMNSESRPNKHFCTECGKGFVSPSHLKKHMLKHTNSRDFYCVECDKSFKSEASLNQHLKTVAPHVSDKEKQYPCTLCDKAFTCRRDIERHMNSSHLNIKPYQCDACDRTYVTKWGLKDHKKIVHEGYKRPMIFPCHLCDKIFDRIQILKAHIRTHTGERPYQCVHCDATFSQSSILHTHVKLVHLRLTRDGRAKDRI